MELERPAWAVPIPHPDLYKLLDFIDDKTIFAFDQDNRMKGKNIHVGYIDTAMVIIPFNSCKHRNIKSKHRGTFTLICTFQRLARLWNVESFLNRFLSGRNGAMGSKREIFYFNY